MSGEYDYLIKVRLPDMSAYRDMLGNILLQLPAAAESRSYVVMEEVKEDMLLTLDWIKHQTKRPSEHNAFRRPSLNDDA